MAFEKRSFNSNLFDVDPGEFFKDVGRQIYDQSPFKKDIKTDIIEYNDHYVVASEIAGFNKADIQLKFDNDTLTIQAKQSESNITDEGKIIHKERATNDLYRQFTFKNIIQEQISAKFDNGVLYVTLPKEQDATVNVASNIEIN
ncbi:Hsp20 family protein [Staphylococcus durrellii]|uniref:Hsp20 family protein n=1 Tax=Staphylococcus durrellii TaxID=2781773 RepID=UPI00189F0DE3|nr:Hsp20 family protein [Staphylococcus durrellii]MBF7016324.1 Hsp20 family protein [Staphylococcus durrellii]